MSTPSSLAKVSYDACLTSQPDILHPLRYIVLAGVYLLVIMKVANCPWTFLAPNALCIPANRQRTHANALRTYILATTPAICASKECRDFFTVWKDPIDLIHSFKGELLDLNCGHVRSPVCAAGPPTTRAWMITTDCAFQVVSMPAATSNRMAWIGAVKLVVWTGRTVQFAKVGNLRRIRNAWEESGN